MSYWISSGLLRVEIRWSPIFGGWLGDTPSLLDAGGSSAAGLDLETQRTFGGTTLNGVFDTFWERPSWTPFASFRSGGDSANHRIRFETFGGSGGRAGSTTVGPIDGLANDILATHVKSTTVRGQHVEGGPIPVGRYRVVRPGSSQRRFIPLEPDQHCAQGRTGLAIHGRGRHGSDGCIVIPTAKYRWLREVLAQSSKPGRIVGTLEVAC